MGISARKVHDYDLFSGHAWYVPGVTGMFGLIAWFLLGSLLGGILTLLMGLFMSPEAIQNYSMIVVYPVQFLPAMVYALDVRLRPAKLLEHAVDEQVVHPGPAL